MLSAQSEFIRVNQRTIFLNDLITDNVFHTTEEEGCYVANWYYWLW